MSRHRPARRRRVHPSRRPVAPEGLEPKALVSDSLLSLWVGAAAVPMLLDRATSARGAASTADEVSGREEDRPVPRTARSGGSDGPSVLRAGGGSVIAMPGNGRNARPPVRGLAGASAGFGRGGGPAAGPVAAAAGSAASPGPGWGANFSGAGTPGSRGPVAKLGGDNGGAVALGGSTGGGSTAVTFGGAGLPGGAGGGAGGTITPNSVGGPLPIPGTGSDASPDGSRSPTAGQCGCDILVDAQTGVATVRQTGNGQPYCGAPRALFMNDTNPHPIVAANYVLPSNQSAPTSFAATLDFGGISTGPVYFDTAGLSPGDPLHFALQVDASSLPTGHYDWTIDLEIYRGTQLTTEQIDGSQVLVNRIDSPYGRRWSIDELDQVFAGTGGVSLVLGDGSTRWFADNGTGGYVTPDGGFSDLTAATGGGWTLSNPDGTYEEFDADGLLTARVDRNGNQSTFAYTDGDGDGQADDLSQATDPAGRTATYSYSGGKLQARTDYYGRAVTFAYSGNLLVSTTQVDPDGAGPLSSSVTTYSYDGNGLLTGITDPDGLTTTIGYDSALRVASVQRPGSAAVTYTPAVVQGLPATGTGSTTTPAAFATDDQAVITTADGTTTIAFDPFGNPTEVTDPLGQVTTYDRDADGLLLELTAPDPDGAGPLSSPVTTFAYDSRGRMTGTTLPDGRSRAWTYDATTGQPTTSRDEDNKTTTYTLDSAGNRLSEVDPLGRTTTYSYDSEGKLTGMTLPDPDGAGALTSPVTTYAYDSLDRLATITLPGGSTRSYGYNSSNDLTTVTDELGRTTTYGYDAMGRLTSVTDPDPDGAGPLSTPVTTYAYRPSGRLASMTDPLGRTTTYGYDTGGRPSTVTQPDPDGAGALLSPVTTAEYDSMGRVETQVDPVGRVTTYAYDALGRLTGVTEPGPIAAGTPINRTAEPGGTASARGQNPPNETAAKAFDGSSSTKWLDFSATSWLGYEFAAPQVIDQYTITSANDHAERDPNSWTFEGSDDGQAWVKLDARSGEDFAARFQSNTYTFDNVTPYKYYRLADIDSDSSIIQLAELKLVGPPTPAITTSYGYDAMSRLTSVTDPLGRVTTYAYDGRDQLTGVTLPDPDGGGSLTSPTYAYGYDPVGRPETVTDPLGRVTTYGYDAAGQLTSVARPDVVGATLGRFDFGTSSSPVASGYTRVAPTTTYGAGLGYGWSSGTIQAVDRSTGSDLQRDLDYTPDGTFEVAAASGTYRVTVTLGDLGPYAHDQVGVYLEGTLADTVSTTGGQVTTRTYTATVTDGRLTLRLRDLGGADVNATILGLEVAAVTSTVTTYAYDNLGRQASVTDPLGRVTTYAYDARNRMTGVTLPDPDGAGSLASPTYGYGYDAVGNNTTVTDPLGGVTTYGYDALNRPVTVTLPDPDGAGALTSPVTTYAYDLAGNRTSVTDPAGNTTTYAYDALDRLATETDPLSHATTYAYDPAGRLTGRTDRLGREVSFAYDGLGLRAVERWLDGGTVARSITYTHDAAGQLTAASDPAADLAFTYDGLGRQATASTSGGGTGQPSLTLTSSYDAAGNRTGLADDLSGTGGSGAGVTTYTYDAQDRLTGIARTLGGSAGPQVALNYDAASRLTSLSRTVGGSGTAVDSAYSYDDLDRLTTLTHGVAGGSTLATYTYGYDAANQLTSETNAEGTVTYTYDANGQLTGVDRPVGQSDESYSYDENGNRTMTGYATGTANRLESSPGATYAYDAEGNLASKTETSSGDVTTYAYDARNRMTGATVRNSGGAVVGQATYTYDALNRRIGTLVDEDGAGSGTPVRTWSAYDGQNTYADFDGTGAVETRYLHGPAVDWLLARTSASGATAWYLTDRLGSVRDVADSSGAVIYHAAYDGFGGLASESGTGGDRFKFTGRELDPVTGVQYNRARYYDAAVGRWTQEDPIGFASSAYNIYRYADNSPSNHIDPSGLDWRGGLGGGIEGGSIGVAGGIGVGAGIGTAILPGPGTAAGGLVGGILGGLGGFFWGWYEGSSEDDLLDGSLQGVRPGLISATVGGGAGGVLGPAAIIYGPEIVMAITTWASQGTVIAGLTAAQIQRLISASGDRCITLATKLTEPPQIGRVLSCATDPRLAEAARQGGRIFTAKIPEMLYRELIRSGHIRVVTTLMNGVIGEEIVITPEASKLLAPFFR